MNLLVIHQNFPGQFRHVVLEALRRRIKVLAIARDTAPGVVGIELRQYRSSRIDFNIGHPYLRGYEVAVRDGQRVFELLKKLKREGLNIGQLKFHREGDDLVIVVNYGVSPKVRVSNHFSEGESAIGYIRVRSGGKATQDYTATEIAERLHPLPPLRDVEDILIKNNEESSIAIAEIVKFYELNS